jgi:N-methylhydantoinase B
MVQPFAIDSITASVVQGALENIAVEMGYKLMRMSYSSIIRESEDFGAALVDAEGRGLSRHNRRRCNRDRSPATSAAS